MCTDEASRQVIRKRSSEVAQYRAVVSGGSANTQLQDEVAALSADERQQLITSAEFSVEIKAEDALAMKADLMIPWAHNEKVHVYM